MCPYCRCSRCRCLYPGGLYPGQSAASLDQNLMRMGVQGLGIVSDGEDIPDDLVRDAAERGGVIVFWADAVAVAEPAEILVAQPMGDQHHSGGYAVVSPETASARGLRVVYDPLEGNSLRTQQHVAPSNGLKTLAFAVVGLALVGGIAYWMWD